jgi:AcrR family transcriptional regulator
MKKRPLSRDGIIRTAVTLADREGLESLSLRRIAARLRVHVTSLYNHVPTKEAVLDGMVQYLMETANLPAQVSGWEQWVREFADGLRAVARQHPGAIKVFHHRPVQGPQASAFPEVGLEAFRSAGFDRKEAYSAVKATALVILGLLIEEAVKLEGRHLETDLSALPKERFPRTHALRTAGIACDVWAYTIDTFVDGLMRAYLRNAVSAKRTAPHRGRKLKPRA